MITDVLPAVLSLRYQGRHRRQEAETVLRADGQKILKSSGKPGIAITF